MKYGFRLGRHHRWPFAAPATRHYDKGWNNPLDVTLATMLLIFGTKAGVLRNACEHPQCKYFRLGHGLAQLVKRFNSGRK